MFDQEDSFQSTVEHVKVESNDPESIIANSYDQVFGDEPEKEPEVENTEETPRKDNDQEETSVPLEEETIESAKGDSENNNEAPKESDEKEIVAEVDLKESLKGVFNKDYIDLLGSIEDPELQKKLIDAGKLQRADLDRKRLDLGETNKLVNILDEEIKTNGLHYNRQQYNDLIRNFIRFDSLFAKDPNQAISMLAKQANIDTTKFNNSIPEDNEEDYRLPEEIERDNKIAMLEETVNQLTKQRQQQELTSVEQELQNFANAKDNEGNLKYPLFDKIRVNMGQLFNDDNPDMTMEKAYNQVVNDLYSDRDAYILQKAEKDRKIQIEKAKKLKKQSIHSSKVTAKTSDPRTKTLEAVEAFLAA